MHQLLHNTGWRRMCVALAVILLTPTFATPAATSEQVARYTAWDAKAGDGFGTSIAVGPQYTLIGAPSIGDTPSAGSVYVYDTESGNMLTPLYPSRAAVGDRFGVALAVHDQYALVGAQFGGGDASDLAGAAHLYKLDPGNHRFRLNAPDSEALDSFGAAVALNANHLLIGAPTKNTIAGVDAGSAYLFNTSNGLERFRFNAPDAHPNARFGASVALTNSSAVIGSPHDSLLATRAGSAHVFDTDTGLHTQSLWAEDPTAGAGFGDSIAVNETLALIGAPGGTSHGVAGAAYLFDITTGQQLLKLTADDATVGDRFGISVAIEDHLALIGATRGSADESSLAGAAYLFNLNTGEQVDKFNTSDTQAIDDFGAAVTLINRTATIGAQGHNTPDGVDAGAAYRFILAPHIIADLNGDGFVGIDDLNLIFDNWNLSTPQADPLADPTGDGFVGFDDLTLVLGSWNGGSPPSGIGFPEPGSAVTALTLLIPALRRRVRS